MNKYKLNVRVTNNKSGIFHYFVTEEDGTNVVSERKSNKAYIACTISGRFYFGRKDLIGKGDHGKIIARNIKNGLEPEPIAYLSDDDFRAISTFKVN